MLEMSLCRLTSVPLISYSGVERAVGVAQIGADGVAEGAVVTRDGQIRRWSDRYRRYNRLRLPRYCRCP